MAGKEEIVVVAEQGHNRIPDQVQERLRKSTITDYYQHILFIENIVNQVQTHVISEHDSKFPDLVLDVDRCQPVDSSHDVHIAKENFQPFSQ